jgi:glyoxylase-like metal-dependent hydrolase (beta-lactamase superfamily II)
MAPQTFVAVGGASAVAAQPHAPLDKLAALQALISCPTYSIHVEDAKKGELAAARDTFPLNVTTTVYHLGYHDEASYGATSYLIVRPKLGNIMVDIPRWAPALAQRVKAFGGARYLFLTHRDDVGSHERWATELGARRIIHSLEVSTRQGTDAAEVQLEGRGPWRLDDEVEIIFTPGHTAGCVSLLYRPEHALFTGDHLAFSPRLKRLTIFRAVNWHSVPVQLESVEKLVGIDFLHVFPGHGRRTSFPDGTTRDEALRTLLSEEGHIPAP